MGIVTMCFMYLQPLNAIFRPHAPARPGEKRTQTRRVWELLHKNLGRLTVLLAFATAGVGLYLPMVELAGVCEGVLGAGSFSVCIILSPGGFNACTLMNDLSRPLPLSLDVYRYLYFAWVALLIVAYCAGWVYELRSRRRDRRNSMSSHLQAWTCVAILLFLLGLFRVTFRSAFFASVIFTSGASLIHFAGIFSLTSYPARVIIGSEERVGLGGGGAQLPQLVEDALRL